MIPLDLLPCVYVGGGPALTALDSTATKSGLLDLGVKIIFRLLRFGTKKMMILGVNFGAANFSDQYEKNCRAHELIRLKGRNILRALLNFLGTFENFLCRLHTIKL